MTYQAMIDAVASVIAERRSFGVDDLSVGRRLAHLLADAGFTSSMRPGFLAILDHRLALNTKEHRRDDRIARRHADTEKATRRSKRRASPAAIDPGAPAAEVHAEQPIAGGAA